MRIAAIGNRRVAVIGSREFPIDCQWLVRDLVWSFPMGTEVYSGGAIGVDTWAYEAAIEFGLRAKDPIRPDYQKYPPHIAPLKRNETLVESVEQVYAFWDRFSGGTIHACRHAKKKGIPVTVYLADGKECPEEVWLASKPKPRSR